MIGNTKSKTENLPRRVVTREKEIFDWETFAEQRT